MKITMLDDICLRAIEKLSDAGVLGAESEVELLKKNFLIGADPNVEGFLKAVKDRAKRIPLGYILGHSYFDGIKFEVAPGTFVPREQSLPLVKDLCLRAANINVNKITDLCAGVGPLGISLARRLKSSSICFVEFSLVARRALLNNAQAFVPPGCNAAISDRDIFTMESTDECCSDSQLVVANPPFVPLGKASMPEYSIHHPKDAIFSGVDGTDAVKRCCELAKSFLAEGGVFGIEHHECHVRFVDDLLNNLGFIDIRHLPDGDGKMRITTATVKPMALKL